MAKPSEGQPRAMGRRYWLALCLIMALPVVPRALGAGLEADDCVKCHAETVALVETRGQRHESAVACLDCHQEHPPGGVNVIPECAMCHPADRNPHYAVTKCVICHDPHAPLVIDFWSEEKVAPVCASCHGEQGAQLRDYPSRHAALDCTACHPTHGDWLDCLKCHQPHSAGMTYQACLSCHQAHRPKVVKYGGQVPNDWCAGCHGGVAATLAANQTKHHALSCVYCHKYQHKLVPDCETCHGRPHGAKMHGKYPDCRECHNGPHALDK